MVLAETRLDRGDGIELVPALRGLPGILDLPVVLFDERPSEHRRNSARAAGASGYLSGPLDASRLASALAHLATERRRRRFARFERALSVSWPGCQTPAVTTEVGRGGCLLRGTVAAPPRGRFALHLPETGRTLRVEAEVMYRLGELTPGPSEGDGLRFCGFDERGRTRVDRVPRADRRALAGERPAHGNEVLMDFARRRGIAARRPTSRPAALGN